MCNVPRQNEPIYGKAAAMITHVVSKIRKVLDFVFDCLRYKSEMVVGNVEKAAALVQLF
jgi:hypothetical protein